MSHHGVVFMEHPVFKHVTTICINRIDGLYVYWYICHINPFPIKVAILMILDTLHQIFITQSMYNYLVTNFGNLLHLEQVVWGMKNFVAALTQGFFAYRVWKLSQGFKWIFVIALLLILIEFTIVFVYAVRGSIQIKTFVQITEESKVFNLQGLDIVNFLLAAVVDTYTQSLINCITAIAAACADILAPDTLVNLGIFFCIGRRQDLFALFDLEEDYLTYPSLSSLSLNYRTIIHKDEQIDCKYSLLTYVFDILDGAIIIEACSLH
ncbi:hypothetical protein F5880DRAFT_1502384 [Lentinula raphanica]|nr:hypothetical protein F5880DRAFT_1502384 [Lentinula raphanica]